ncbi:MAG: copper chaperone PCu(A)C [Acidimicrobiia bacterium]
MSPSKKSLSKSVLGLAVAGTFLLGACGDDGGSTTSESTAATSAAASSAPKISGQWVRASSTDMTAAYMTITSADGDKLVSASVDKSIAGMVQIHETVAMDASATSMGSMGSDTTMGHMGSDSSMAGSGEMKMQEVKSIDLPKGTAVELKPGGYHVMVMELAKPLEKGSEVKLTLTFEKAGTVDVTAPVSDVAPG